MLQSMKVILVMVFMTILSRGGQPAHAGAYQAPATSQGHGSTASLAWSVPGSGERFGVCSDHRSHPTLRFGSTGFPVAHAQCILRYDWDHPELEYDGRFGPITEAAVRDVQQRTGLVVDGVVGPCTWKLLHGEYVPASCMR
jgi:peptidoglycan hydrolase-like protein with peptidoglycan-binding domain